ncbi:CPBP family intramembrane glutamic endopeptidase [Maribacter sp. CXY002]|uniref:CPBP family intramembrane glutamic endopeptidase n=1 Tax=Maribacter luteocoastalis TaxID=3407671 RepID=UPI003B671F22
MLFIIWEFVKDPKYIIDDHTNLEYRFTAILKLTGIAIAFSFLFALIIGGLETALELNFGKHAMDDFFENYSKTFLFGAAVVVAPLIEETIFRGPMAFFKHSKLFPVAFYILNLVFGFYHITNFEITTLVLMFSPLLVAPKIFVGFLLGYVRVKFGLIWAILMHALYNLIIVGPIILFQMLNTPLQ